MKAVRFVLLILLVVVCGFSDSFGQTSAIEPVQKTTSDSSLDLNPDSKEKEEPYRIGLQDTLEVQIFPAVGTLPNQRVSINPDGTISLLRASKPIMAVCKTERELAKDIEKEYSSILRKPEIRVFAVEKVSRSYGVIGAVEKAGTFYISRRIRLLDLLAAAGGPNKEAGDRLLIARTGSSSACKIESDDSVIDNETILVNFRMKEVMQGKQNPWMKPGDIISVLDADEVYVYGNVNKVGSVIMKEPITLMQAISAAEGIKSTSKRKVRILRQKEGSAERDEFTYDLKDIESRKINDPLLEPSDIVAVSEDPTKTVIKGVTDTLKSTIPGLIYLVR